MLLAVTRVPPPVKPLAVALMVTPTGAVRLDLTLLPEVEVVRLDLRVVREEVRYCGTGGGGGHARLQVQRGHMRRGCIIGMKVGVNPSRFVPPPPEYLQCRCTDRAAEYISHGLLYLFVTGPSTLPHHIPPRDTCIPLTFCIGSGRRGGRYGGRGRNGSHVTGPCPYCGDAGVQRQQPRNAEVGVGVHTCCRPPLP